MKVAEPLDNRATLSQVLLSGFLRLTGQGEEKHAMAYLLAVRRISDQGARQSLWERVLKLREEGGELVDSSMKVNDRAWEKDLSVLNNKLPEIAKFLRNRYDWPNVVNGSILHYLEPWLNSGLQIFELSQHPIRSTKDLIDGFTKLVDMCSGVSDVLGGELWEAQQALLAWFNGQREHRLGTLFAIWLKRVTTSGHLGEDGSAKLRRWFTKRLQEFYIAEQWFSDYLQEEQQKLSHPPPVDSQRVQTDSLVQTDSFSASRVQTDSLHKPSQSHVPDSASEASGVAVDSGSAHVQPGAYIRIKDSPTELREKLIQFEKQYCPLGVQDPLELVAGGLDMLVTGEGDVWEEAHKKLWTRILALNDLRLLFMSECWRLAPSANPTKFMDNMENAIRPESILPDVLKIVERYRKVTASVMESELRQPGPDDLILLKLLILTCFLAHFAGDLEDYFEFVPAPKRATPKLGLIRRIGSMLVKNRR